MFTDFCTKNIEELHLTKKTVQLDKMMIFFVLIFSRFFFEYIWRGWDEEDDSSYNFVTRHIEPRLKL